MLLGPIISQSLRSGGGKYYAEHGRKQTLTFCAAHRMLRAWQITDPFAFGDHLVYPCRWGVDPAEGPCSGPLHWHIGRPGPRR